MKDVSPPDLGGPADMLNTRELLDIAGVSRQPPGVGLRRPAPGEETVLDRLFTSPCTNKYFREDPLRHSGRGDHRRHRQQRAGGHPPEVWLAAPKGRQILQRIISSPSWRKVQEALITQRDGRFVVPVKAECKGSMPGLVHDISSSGATLFVGPWAWCRPTMS